MSLDAASSTDLDRIGAAFKLARYDGEPDWAYRERIRPAWWASRERISVARCDYCGCRSELPPEQQHAKHCRGCGRGITGDSKLCATCRISDTASLSSQAYAWTPVNDSGGWHD